MEACNAFVGWVRGFKATIGRHFREAAIRRELRLELAGLGADLDRVLADAGLTRDEMETVIENAPRSRMLLQSMVRRLDFDRRLSMATPQLVRAIERRCATCSNQKKCGDWLGKGAPGDAYRRFCSNAAAFDSLPHAERMV